MPDGRGLQAGCWTACSVITVLGAEVPDGRALSSWITGLARPRVFGHGIEETAGRSASAGLTGAEFARTH